MKSLALAFCTFFFGSIASADCGGWGNPAEFILADGYDTGPFFFGATPADIQRCLDLGHDPNFRGQRGLTPLFAALSGVNNGPKVETLVRAGADIHTIWKSPFWNDSENHVYNTVSWSMSSGQLDSVFRLLDLGVTSDIQPISGLSALFYPTSVHMDDEWGGNERTNADLLQILLKNNPDLEVRNAFGQTPLLAAVRGVNESFAIALIEAGADVTAIDDGGRGVLHHAVESVNAKILIPLLLDRGADIEAQLPNGMTPFQLAISIGYSARAEALIEAGANIDPTESFPVSALAMAVRGGNISGVKVLMDEGVSINAPDASGVTPIMIAADALREVARDMKREDDNNLYAINTIREAKGWAPITMADHLSPERKNAGRSEGYKNYYASQMMEELVRAGADLSARDANGTSAYQRLLEEVQAGTPYIDNTNIFLALSEQCKLWKREPKSLINLQFMTISAEGLEACMRTGEISEETSPGKRPLISIAARTTQDVDLIQNLLDRGGNVFGRYNRSMETLLHIQARSQYSTAQMAQFFLDAGLSVNERDSSGNTPLHAAAKVKLRGNVDPPMIEFLISKGADVTAVNQKGASPLHIMLLGDLNRDKFRLLVENGADVNASDKSGLTPLHYAVIYRADDRISLSSVKALLDLGANPNSIDREGKTPLQAAIERGSVENDALALLRRVTN
jgi:ankyrin repeat protein